MVSDVYSMRHVLRTAAHEWDALVLVLSPVWKELLRVRGDDHTERDGGYDCRQTRVGDIVFERMGGDLSENARRYDAADKVDKNFTKFMRDTRTEAERLLSEGSIEEAEEYMRKRQWDLRLRGYYIRKLNQAYFAFRGRYADSPASISPAGDQMEELALIHGRRRVSSSASSRRSAARRSSRRC